MDLLTCHVQVARRIRSQRWNKTSSALQQSPALAVWWHSSYHKSKVIVTDSSEQKLFIKSKKRVQDQNSMQSNLWMQVFETPLLVGREDSNNLLYQDSRIKYLVECRNQAQGCSHQSCEGSHLNSKWARDKIQTFLLWVVTTVRASSICLRSQMKIWRTWCTRSSDKSRPILTGKSKRCSPTCSTRLAPSYESRPKPVRNYWRSSITP